MVLRGIHDIDNIRPPIKKIIVKQSTFERRHPTKLSLTLSELKTVSMPVNSNLSEEPVRVVVEYPPKVTELKLGPAILEPFAANLRPNNVICHAASSMRDAKDTPEKPHLDGLRLSNQVVRDLAAPKLASVFEQGANYRAPESDRSAGAHALVCLAHP